MKLLGRHGQVLPPALSWSLTSSTAAAISYADRGTSAIVASQLLDELHWTEGQLGHVQASFFVGYAITQVLGGLLGGGGSRRHGENSNIRRTSSSDSYRTVLPLSLFLSAIATLLFPIAAKLGGAGYASLDRFCLGLFEGLLLPAAMAGVSDMNRSNNATTSSYVDKATASSIVIAGCYFGSAWAYFSASVLFTEQSQIQLLHWVNAIDTTITTSSNVSVWSWVFYLNGLISLVCLVLFRDEFDFIFSPLTTIFIDDKKSSGDTKNDNIDDVNLWKETQLIVKSTLSSKSGRAIILAQIGQGALLYSIASWGPLYLERIATSSLDATAIESNIIFDEIAFAPSPPPSLPSSSSVSPTYSSSAVSASIAASSLILPQITQALVGVGIGLSADKLSSMIGTRTTRRSLQIASGVVPAILLWHLSYRGSNSNGDASGNDNVLTSPVFVFAAAQTISALSLGAVSVSHLDIAVPSSAGAVYALGNVAAAASGSLVINLFGRLLDDETVEDDEFALPFRIIATLSAVGSLIYGCTVESEIEIGLNGTAV